MLTYLDWAADDPRWHWVVIQPIRGAAEDSADNEGHFASMAARLHRGIDANVSRYGQTALHFAATRHGSLGEEARARFAGMLLDYSRRLSDGRAGRDEKHLLNCCSSAEHPPMSRTPSRGPHQNRGPER